MRRLATVATVAALAVGATSGAAVAYWTTTDMSNPAAAVAETLPAGATPVATVNGTTVTVSFAQAVTSASSGQLALTSYRINRYAGTGPAVASSTCTPAVAGGTATCTLTTVPGGTWLFTDTPLLAGWVGGESPKTASSVAVTPSFAITAGQSASSLPATLTGGTVAGFASGDAVSFRLDSATGPALTSSVSAVDGNGQATGFTVTLPAGLATADGTHTIVAVGASSGSASSNGFTLALPATLAFTGSTTLTTLPGTLTASVGSFRAGETVRFYLDATSGTALTSVLLAASGAASGVSVPIPASIARGTHTVNAVGDAGSVASATFTVGVGSTLSFTGSAVTIAAPMLSGGSLSYFHAGSLVTFRLDGATGTVLTSSVAVTTDAYGTASGFSVDPGGAQGSHTVWAVDAAGDQATFAFTADTIAPTTTDTSASIGTGWLRTAQTLLLTATDSGSGVAATYYTTNGSTPTTASAVYGSGIALPGDGSYVVKYFSVDRVGNAEAVRTAGTINIDRTAPVVSAVAAGPSSLPVSGWVTTGTPFYVYANAADATSGIARVTADVHLIDGVAGDTAVTLSSTGGPWTAGGVTYAYRSAALQVSAGLANLAKPSYTVVAADGAGNTSTAQSPAPTVSVDDSAPTATDNAPSGWQRVASVTVTITPSDTPAGGSGVYATYYTTDGTTPSPTHGSTGTSVTLSGDGVYTLSYVVYDAAGNASPVTQRTVRIDRTAPVISAIAAGPQSATAVGYLTVGVAAKIYAAVSEPVSGVATMTATLQTGLASSPTVTLTVLATPVTIGGTTYNYAGSFNTSGTLSLMSYTFSVTATDVAGNSSTNSGGTVNTSDRTAPTGVAITQPTSGGTFTGVFAGTAGTSAAGSGDQQVGVLTIYNASIQIVLQVSVTISSGRWSYSGTLPTGSYYAVITQYDGAGNATTVWIPFNAP